MLLEAIAQYLHEQNVAVVGLAGSTSGNLFVEEMPDGPSIPDPCITIQSYAGPAPIRVQPKEQASDTTPSTIVEDSYEQPRFQVLVRSVVKPTAEQKAYEVWGAVSRIKNMALDGTKYLSVEPVQSPFLLRRDENRRYHVVFNAEVVKRVG